MMVLVGALALSGVAVASASAALPEFNNRTSSTAKFSGIGSATLEYAHGSTYTCSEVTATGEIEPGKGKTMKNVVLAFKACSAKFCSPLTTTTKPLTGTLGYINQATKEVGLLLKPSSGPVAECTAITVKGSIVGSVIVEIGPIGKETGDLILHARQGRSVQDPLHFEGESESHILESIFTEAGFHKVGEHEKFGLATGELEIESEHKVEIEA